MKSDRRLMCKIYFDWYSGELEEIIYSEDWKEASQLEKADVLSDVIGVLQEDYEKYSAGIIDEARRDVEAIRRQLKENEQKSGKTRQ